MTGKHAVPAQRGVQYSNCSTPQLAVYFDRFGSSRYLE
jgi:hypothetical protein